MTRIQQYLIVGVVIIGSFIGISTYKDFFNYIVKKSVESSESIEVARSRLMSLQDSLQKLKNDSKAFSFIRDSNMVVTQSFKDGSIKSDTTFNYFITVEGLDSLHSDNMEKFLNEVSQDMGWDSMKIFFNPFIDGSDGKFIAGAEGKWIGRIPDSLSAKKYLEEHKRVVNHLKELSEGKTEDSIPIEFFTYRRFSIVDSIDMDMGIRYAIGFYDPYYDIIVGIAAPQSSYSQILQKTYNIFFYVLGLFAFILLLLILWLISLMKDRAQFKEALDDSVSGVAILKEDSTIEYINKQFKELYGNYYKEGDLFKEKSKYPKFISVFNKCLDKGRAEYTNQGELNSKTLHSKVTLNKFSTKDGEIKIILVSHDITQLQELNDELKRINEELNIWIHAIPHDIIMPLYSPLSVARDIIEKFGINMEFKEELQEILNGVGNAIKVVTNYREYSMLILKSNRGPKNNIKLIDPIEDVINTLKPLDKINDIQFNLKLDRKLIVKGHKTELESIFKNIFINSIIAIKGKKTQIEIEKNFKGNISVFGKQIGDTIELSVVDNGKGMSSTEVNRLFNPNHSKKGLGSHIVSSLVQLNNIKNEIKVISHKEKGTEIKIIFKTDNYGCIDN